MPITKPMTQPAAGAADLAKRNRRMALIHLAIALGFLAAFVFTTVRG